MNRPDKTDFVRMAALFNATIVPFAAIGKDKIYKWYVFLKVLSPLIILIGIADSVELVLDGTQKSVNI